MSLAATVSLPHGGAWIETNIFLYLNFTKMESLPHGGAWIETAALVDMPAAGTSLPHGGAWIETSLANVKPTQSHRRSLTGERGLKQILQNR